MRYSILSLAVLAMALLLVLPEQVEAQTPQRDRQATEERDRQAEREARQQQQRDRQQQAREESADERDNERAQQGARRGQIQEARPAREAQEAGRQEAATQRRAQEAARQRQGARQGQVQEAGRQGARAPRRAEEAARQRAGHQRGGAAGGPMFCRTGQGHPVYGMQWCHDKRFQTPTWRPGSLGDIIWRRDAPRQGTIGGMILENVLGRDAVRTTRERAGRDGLRGDLAGTWLDAQILEVSMEGVPVLRLIDTNGDGRFDRSLIAEY